MVNLIVVVKEMEGEGKGIEKRMNVRLEKKRNLEIRIIEIIRVFLMKRRIRNLEKKVNEYNVKI
ncbi:hypothetical protein [Staphylococcus epidermidis]|uniref:hypothetical protein n=1 Tax=Staphylococcus epidermidis TaxID=1282 RepID=UPI0011A4B052|nr:hypothetical protein [Staphylococcus epidermidis]